MSTLDKCRALGYDESAVGIKTLLKDYLQTLQAGGESRLPVDESARAVLRGWMLAARNGGVRPVPAPVAQPQIADVPAQPTPQQELGDTIAQLRDALETTSPPSETEGDEEIFFRPAGRTPDELWEQAQKLILRWPPLRELHTLRENLVWGEGARPADIMFVGDAPNYYDEQTGRPFCGEAGAKLDGMLKAMGLSRQDVYITHLIKFRPMVPRQTFNNRPPSRDEVRLSVPVLDFEVKQVRPKVIVALGVIAARALLGREDLPLAACQQVSDACFCGVPVVVTHHPSYLLRTTSLAERRRLWEEMLRVMQMVGLPISAKQQSYFLPKA